MRKALARQLAEPHGLGGRLVGAVLNRYNHPSMATAAAELALSPGATAADLGFGGGTGLGLLLKHVGPTGRVHGVDVSTTMLDRAARRYRNQLDNGQLQLHTASMTQLPLPDDVLDGALTFNTVYYLADLDHALSELRRVLSSTGRAILGLADPDAMAARSFAQHGLRLRAISDITDMLAPAGLRLTDHQQLNHRSETFHLLVTEPHTDLAGAKPVE
ncbi:methyltransferase domain-containing protein [Sciscionella marina]|uniref:methyltransferase domain-containing protein n=1 Tax=Sciscionella marina TaxID=508770 RepID=UPI000684F102|nr:methyltransferase domain-containing protein [Sciscionella marina]